MRPDWFEDENGEYEAHERDRFVDQLDTVTIILLLLVGVGLILTVTAQVGMAVGRWLA